MFRKLLTLGTVSWMLAVLPVSANETDKLAKCLSSFQYSQRTGIPIDATVHSSRDDYYLVRMDTKGSYFFQVVTVEPCERLYFTGPGDFGIEESTSLPGPIAKEFDEIRTIYARQFNRQSPR